MWKWKKNWMVLFQDLQETSEPVDHRREGTSAKLYRYNAKRNEADDGREERRVVLNEVSYALNQGGNRVHYCGHHVL